MSAVRRRPLIAFFVLAYAFSWWPWPLYALGLSLPSPIIGFGPFFAAVLVLALSGGKAAVKMLLRRMVRWRVGPLWYAAALLLPVAISLGATVLNVLLGARSPSSAELGAWPSLIPTYFLLLLIPGIGGAWEEPGWRGYALPKLQVGGSAFVGSLILGVVWALWHLPLMVAALIPWSDIAMVSVQSVVYAWLFNNTRGSVLLVMLFHTTTNVIGGGFFDTMFSGADWVRMGWLQVALWCAVALIVVVVSGPEHLSRNRAKQTPTPAEEGARPAPRVA